ncbi:DUF4123 domain-containing protein [Pseudomonas sp. ICMP 460]|uniref:DUF4123 domain-containing protein n=1 Tax=Pseudomonas sp. ICMP 460 TaxID=1718917 RepID=UPI000C081E5C|nr:DUF4123 domain-containing protein [Pseudomonas sp. ICMP 460]PHN26821.1 hypothetical protein AO240_01025 [Pseudomonas sp. ICMP 460]
MNNPSPANFVLIDGVLRPDAIKHLYQRGEPLDIVPLYIGTRWQELHDVGPILVSLQGSSALINDICQSAFQQADASLLYSRAPMPSVAAHLRRFIAPPDVLGGNGLLRFADPLVTRYWLGSHQGEHLDAVLGPIEAWHIPQIPHSWELAQSCEWRSVLRGATPPEWVNTYAQLGEAQLAALDQAARWRFMERLNQSFEQSHPERMAKLDPVSRTQWFDQRLDEADTWGLSSERSLAIWVEYSLRWGTGFTVRPNSPYQQWLASTAVALKLAPELRIQQMDNDCLAIEIDEEV